MQNKKTIKVFAILFAIVCLYQLSFTWKVNQIEDDAANYALNVKNNPKNIKKAEIKASKYSSEQQRIAVKQSELNQIEKAAERSYLDSMNNVKVLGPYTYFDCKQRELNLGLDLKGGMNVTLEYSEGIGLYLPYNVVTWIFISFWIGLGNPPEIPLGCDQQPALVQLPQDPVAVSPSPLRQDAMHREVAELLSKRGCGLR